MRVNGEGEGEEGQRGDADMRWAACVTAASHDARSVSWELCEWEPCEWQPCAWEPCEWEPCESVWGGHQASGPDVLNMVQARERRGDGSKTRVAYGTTGPSGSLPNLASRA